VSRLGTVVSRLGTVFFLVIWPNPAAAKCHLFSVWHYPKPQRCFTALAPEQIRNRGRHVSALHQFPSASVQLPPERIEILLPAVEFVPCPDGDERFQGIAKLHALMDAPRP
jgi:hypothetical protein